MGRARLTVLAESTGVRAEATAVYRALQTKEASRGEGAWKEIFSAIYGKPEFEDLDCGIFARLSARSTTSIFGEQFLRYVQLRLISTLELVFPIPLG